MGLKGCIICGVCRTLRDAKSESNAGTSIMPYEVYYRLKAIGEEFEFGREADAADFFRSLIEAMRRAYPAKMNESSPIFDIFSGHQTQTIECESCGNVSNSNSPFELINLEINNKTKKLDDVLKLNYDLGFVTDYNCMSCNKQVSARQRFRIATGPKTLCIQLNRFVKDETRFKKLTNVVKFSEHLDMTNYTNDEKPLRYRLGSVISHMGNSIDHGHYKSFCFVDSTTTTPAYYEFDDSLVSRITSARVLQQQAYILFYYLVNDEE